LSRERKDAKKVVWPKRRADRLKMEGGKVARAKPLEGIMATRKMQKLETSFIEPNLLTGIFAPESWTFFWEAGSRMRASQQGGTMNRVSHLIQLGHDRDETTEESWDRSG